MTAGYAFWRTAIKIVFYIDRGMSNGMKRAEERAVKMGFKTEYRRIGDID